MDRAEVAASGVVTIADAMFWISRLSLRYLAELRCAKINSIDTRGRVMKEAFFS